MPKLLQFSKDHLSPLLYSTMGNFNSAPCRLAIVRSFMPRKVHLVSKLTATIGPPVKKSNKVVKSLRQA